MGKNWHRKYTRKNLKDDAHHKNNGHFWIWVIMILIIAGFIYFYNPTIKEKVNNFFEDSENSNIPSSLNTEAQENIDDLMSKCKKSLNECIDIGKRKYGWSFSLLEAEKFENSEEAEKFFKIWHGPSQLSLESMLREDVTRRSDIQKELPIILFPLSIKQYSIQLPFVVACNNKGELSAFSKSGIGC